MVDDFPRVEALAFQRDLETGSSKPSIFRCVDHRNREDEWVVKFRSELFRKEASCFFECFALRLAQYFTIRTADPAIVNISDSLAEALRGNDDVYPRLRENRGLNFGTRLLRPGFAPWPVDAKISQNLVQDAARIFAFDVLIDNGNRVRQNPNLLSKSDRILVLDHELTFQFLHHGKSSTWQDLLEQRAAHRDHPLMAGLRNQTMDLSGFRHRLEELDDDTVDSMCKGTPEEFQVVDLVALREWLSRARAEADIFAKKVTEVLA